MTKNLIKSLVIGFGFLNGLWLAIGISPQDELIKFLRPILSEIHPILKTLFIILPAILIIGTIITLFIIYKKGGIIGSLAVLTAFIAGAIILKNYIISIGLLLIAIIIGHITFKRKI
ncbi:MAG: hypothetical protein ACP5NV_05320 [Candidatus Woesearchaeota archaeon]